MVAFVNSFLSYLVLFLIMAALVGIGILAGAFLRKRKDAAVQTEEAGALAAEQEK